VSCTATFTDAGDGVEVELSVRGLPEPGVTYLAHIHQGACASEPDGGAEDHAHHYGSTDEPNAEIEYPLSPVVPNTGGSGSSTTVIEDATVARLFSGNPELYVNVHAEASGSEGLPDTLVCGDLRGFGEHGRRGSRG
jgi:CHRD domain-containing protein